MRNIALVIWMSLEHMVIPRAIMKTRFYQFFINHYYPVPFEHWCVFCRKFTDDWWEEPDESRT
jgi:hypothetical protein